MSLKTYVKDSFVNFAARLGIGANNQFSNGSYQFDFLTRNRTQLEAGYRTSWMIGKAVDAPAEDMTQAGIEIASVLKPDQIETLQAAMLDLQLWQRLADTIRWSRLFGGAIAVMLIDGQDVGTPLNIKNIGKGAFKGLLVLDRWLVQPSLQDLVTDFGPYLGFPKYYQVIGDSQALPNMKIHYTRCIRIDGLDLPYYQKMAENHWGESIIERIHDRLLAFDSTTQGAAQLVFKAHLRTLSVEGLREIIAIGGKAMEGLAAQIENIRLYQSSEGLTLIDAKDKLEYQTYTFSGLSDLLIQFGQQLSGAIEIPLVRLFGQSPAGLNSTGESDLRTYYDGIKKAQETRLRRPVTVLLDVLCRSVLGIEPPQGFTFTFRPLWQTSDTEKADIGGKVTTAVTQAFEAGLVSQAVALRELRQGAHASNLWSNISDEDIEDADQAPPQAEIGGEEDPSMNEGAPDGEEAESDPV